MSSVYLWAMCALLWFYVIERETGAKSVMRRQVDSLNDTMLPGYRRFRENISYIGKPITCTDDEKVCFQYNLVLDTESDTCQAIGKGYYKGCKLQVDTKEYFERSGRVSGVCRQYEDPCPGYRMSYDGRCYTEDVVQNVICDECDGEPTRDVFGNWECRCETATPISVEQPMEASRCKIPDLRFPDEERISMKQSPLESQKFHDHNCSSEQRRCFSEQKVWVGLSQGCFTLLEQGTCAEDEVVVLTKLNWTRGPAVCRQVRGDCPPGRIRMAFDGECHSERDIQISAPGAVSLNIMGEYDVVERFVKVVYTPMNQNGGACGFDIECVEGPPLSKSVEKPKCIAENDPECGLYEVYDIPPSPE